MVHVWLTERGGGLVNASTWGDWSSVGTALSADSGGDRESAENLTRAVREAVLHEAADG